MLTSIESDLATDSGQPTNCTAFPPLGVAGSVMTPMPTPSFNAGDTVQLKSGGPVMTCNSPPKKLKSKEPQVSCRWLLHGAWYAGIFDASALRMVAAVNRTRSKVLVMPFDLQCELSKQNGATMKHRVAVRRRPPDDRINLVQRRGWSFA